jgi:hypothetical protein
MLKENASLIDYKEIVIAHKNKHLKSKLDQNLEYEYYEKTNEAAGIHQFVIYTHWYAEEILYNENTKTLVTYSMGLSTIKEIAERTNGRF